MVNDTAPVGRGDSESFARAQGKFVLFLASLLERASVVTVDEFSGLLSTFAATVLEDDPREGEILAGWAKALRSLWLSDLEREQGNTSVDLLDRLAAALDVPIAALFAVPANDAPVPRPLPSGRRPG